MKDKVVVTVGNDDHEVNLKALTIMCHPGGLNVEIADPEIVTISPTDTIAMFNSCPAADWRYIRQLPRFIKMFRCVFGPDIEVPLIKADAPIDVQHVCGLLMCIGAVSLAGKVPFIKLPETYLHPRHHTGLGDLMVRLSTGQL